MDGWNGWVDGWDEMVQGSRFKYGLTCSSAFASSTRPARWLCFRIASRSIWYLPQHHINLVLRIKNFTRPGNEIIGLPQYISWFWFYLVRRWMGLISRSVSRSLNPYFNRISWREKKNCAVCLTNDTKDDQKKVQFHEDLPQSSRLCVPTQCALTLACSGNTRHTCELFCTKHISLMFGWW